MILKINGKETGVKDGLTVKGLLESLQIEPGRVAVEVNMKILKKSDFGSYMLQEGDSLEIVNFVGGG